MEREMQRESERERETVLLRQVAGKDGMSQRMIRRQKIRTLTKFDNMYFSQKLRKQV